jgi:hypothetical protein
MGGKPFPAFQQDERIAATRRRITAERQRVRRCLDDIRHGLALPIKRCSERPVLYAISDLHAAYLVKSAAGWLPLAWRAYRAAQADLHFLEALIASRASPSRGAARGAVGALSSAAE